MNGRVVWMLGALMISPTVISAQQLDGQVGWTLSQGATATDEDRSENRSVWQNYSLGYAGPVWDPRLMKYSAAVSWRINSLDSSTRARSQRGHQNDLGYRIGGTLFPLRSFPLSIQTTRDAIRESGDYPSASGIRGGLVQPGVGSAPNVLTINKATTIGWNVTPERLPRIELGYHSGSSVATSGPFQAEQNDRDMRLGVFKDTRRTRHVLRAQHTSFDNLIAQAFNQRTSDLGYEFTGLVSDRVRISARTGRRGTFSQFERPTTFVDPGTSGFSLPASSGQVHTLYATSGINYNPTSRLSLDLTANVDREESSTLQAGARLVSGSAHYEVFKGLSAFASGTFGQRSQTTDTYLTVMTRNGLVGTNYRAGVPWLEGAVGATRGRGTNTTVEGLMGDNLQGSEQASLSSTIGWLGMQVAYGHAMSRDDILDFGNYDSQRRRASLHVQGVRFTMDGSWEQTLVERGRGLTFASALQRTYVGSVSYRLNRETLVAADAGGFTTRSETGEDQTLFWGGMFKSQIGRSLTTTAWVRRDAVAATQTHLDQRSLYWLAQVDYQVRLFTFGVDYRHNDQRVQYTQLPGPYRFRGHQVNLRVTRRFGVQW